MEQQTLTTTTGIVDKHPVLAVAEQVEAAFADAGHEVDLTGPLAERAEQADFAGGVTPNLSGEVWDFLREGQAPFSLNHLLDNQDHTGVKQGAANVTSIAEQMDMGVREVVTSLIDDGQVDDCRAAIEFGVRQDDDPDALWIVAYILMTYGVGWFAEQVAANMDEFSAGGVTNDQAGQDLRHEPTGEYLQLKPMTTYSKKGPDEFAEMDVQHVFYQFARDGTMRVATAYQAADMNKAIAKGDGISATLARTKHYNYKHPEDGDRYRYLWW